MNPFALPWLELAVAVPLVGAACVAFVRDALASYRWCVAFAAITLGCAMMSCVGHFAERSPGPVARALEAWAGRPVLTVDGLSAPLLLLVALLHALTALATARTKAPRFSFPVLLGGAAVRLAAVACAEPWAVVGLLALEAVLPYLDIRQHGARGRLYALHAGAFVALLAAGSAVAGEAGAVLTLAAVLVRMGVFPAHVWVTDLFEKGSFGMSLLFATPLVGAYVAVRLVLPTAPEWALGATGLVALGTAVYAAGMGAVEQDARRFFAYLIVSHASLVLVGLGLHTPFALTGALVMSVSATLSLTGLALTLRAVEARVGSLTLTGFRGLYEHSPALAVCFLLTGLATVGFPCTSGFVAVELLVDEAVGRHEAVGVVVVFAAAINGIGVVRAYLLLFTGRRHVTGVGLGITTRERVAVLTLSALILGGGLFPQAYLETWHGTAESVLRDRHEKTGQPAYEAGRD